MGKISTEVLAALIMIASAILAVIVNNIGWHDLYSSYIHMPIKIGTGPYSMTLSLETWVNELLMAIFFLNITLELKAEFYEGFLVDRRQFILPLLATIGGMVFPGMIYYFINYQNPENLIGFAIPCATDIAFAMCIFSLLGKGLSSAIRVFLLSIAIFDDLGSMLIIALFYNQQLLFAPLILAVVLFAIMLVLGYNKVANFWPYLLLASAIWICFHTGGMHSTMAGVVLGSVIPMYSKDKLFSPLKKLNHIILPWVRFFILPIFAFVASGVEFIHMSWLDLLNPISLGIICGLFFGKQIGIFLVTWLSVKSGIAPLAKESNWFEVYFVSCLAGIGFTMSLFIGDLAFTDSRLADFVKIGVLASSVLIVIYSSCVSLFKVKKA